MQLDFHYYATYAAAFLAGYSHDESLQIAYSAQFVDCCTRTILKKTGAPLSAATTQTQAELADADTDFVGLQDITRIWASFHFLPADLYAERKGCTKRYLRKYRLICGPNGALLRDTVELVRGKGVEAIGIAMHVLADTWAHRYFAGTPSLVINNTNNHFYELIGNEEIKITFAHNPLTPDDLETRHFTSTIHQSDEHSVMNLGHGRAGHLPDYSFMRYKYMPAWGEYREIVKDNPAEYLNAFCQMIYALKWLKENPDDKEFSLNCYDEDAIRPYKEEIEGIVSKRQLDASDDWKAFGEKLSGETIPDFDIEVYQKEYMDAEEDAKMGTPFGKFITAALSQKSMVTNRIYESKSMLAGVSIDYKVDGFKGIRDFALLLRREENEIIKELIEY